MILKQQIIYLICVKQKDLLLKFHHFILIILWLFGYAVQCFSCSSFASSTMGRQLGETALKKRVKKVVKDNEALPFGTLAPAVTPKTMCDKQRLWVMNGLRYLKAPAVL